MSTQTSADPTTDKPVSSRKLAVDFRQYGILAALVAIIVLFEVLTGGRLLLPGNVNNLIQQNSYVLILAIGMVMVIIAGHIDLSVGSLVAMIGAVAALAMNDWHLPWWLAVLVALLVGCARRRVAGILGRLRRDPGVHRDAGGHAALPRPHARLPARRHHRWPAPGVRRDRRRLAAELARHGGQDGRAHPRAGRDRLRGAWPYSRSPPATAVGQLDLPVEGAASVLGQDRRRDRSPSWRCAGSWRTTPAPRSS